MDKNRLICTAVFDHVIHITVQLIHVIGSFLNLWDFFVNKG